jgi:hypothetical protein
MGRKTSTNLFGLRREELHYTRDLAMQPPDNLTRHKSPRFGFAMYY